MKNIDQSHQSQKDKNVIHFSLQGLMFIDQETTQRNENKREPKTN